MKATCSVTVCDEPVFGRGWCKAHYARWLSKGDPGTTPIRKKQPGSKCQIDGCERPHKSRGWCKPHYRRWQNTGDPGGLDFIIHPVARERLTYNAVHIRLRATLGSATEQTCTACGQGAHQWAYQHDDPDPLMKETGLLYSDNFACYAPMCRHCHVRLDAIEGRRVIHSASRSA